MNIPDFSNIVYIVFLLTPGFVSLMLIQYIAMFERKLSDFEITVWSLFMSSIILIMFNFLLGINSFIDMMNYMFYFDRLFIFNVIGICIGVIAGFIIKIRFRKRILSGSPWDNSFDNVVKGAWILIKMKTGEEILGKILRSSRGPSEREVLLTEPKFIKRKNDDIPPELKEIDGNVLINGKDMNLTIFYKEDEEEAEE